MSFRQFPATDANGESHVVIEFKADEGTAPEGQATPRYELEDGRVLIRTGRGFATADGELRLHI